MVKCPNCGEENREGLKICLHCGCELPDNIKPEQQKKVSLKEQERHKTPKEPERRKTPKEPKESDPVPTKKNHTLRKGVIILVFLLIIGYLLLNMASVSVSESNQANSISLEDNYQDDVKNDISSSSANDNGVQSSSSTKIANFNNLFSMEIDSDETFREYDFEEDYGSTFSWVDQDFRKSINEEDVGMQVFYWEDRNANDVVKKIDTVTYLYESKDYEDLIILQSIGAGDGMPRYTDYIVLTSSDDKTVGIMGPDADKLIEYSKSVKFN